MWTRHFISRRNRLTSFGLGVVVLCVLPFLFDVALCDEFSAAPLLEPTVLDGEKVEPSKAIHHSFESEYEIAIAASLENQNDGGTQIAIDFLDRPHSRPFLVFLISRSPPQS